jgi:hypothetical protein
MAVAAIDLTAHQLWLVPARLSDRDHQVLPRGTARTSSSRTAALRHLRAGLPGELHRSCSEYSVAPEKLEVAKAKARVFAANQRKMKQQREAVARRTLEALAARSATRA